jgi:hypothetical protein
VTTSSGELRYKPTLLKLYIAISHTCLTSYFAAQKYEDYFQMFENVAFVTIVKDSVRLAARLNSINQHLIKVKAVEANL